MAKDYNITIREASEILGVSITTIRRYIRSGQLSKVYVQGKYGNTIMLCKEELDQLTKGRGQGSLTTEQMIKVGRYEELKTQYEALKREHEALLFRLGAIETKYKELESEASSLRDQKPKSLWTRIREWWTKNI